MRDVQVWMGHFFLVGGVFRESSIEEFIMGTVFLSLPVLPDISET